MPYLTMREKNQLSPAWFSRLLRHPTRKRSGSVLGHNTHTHIFTYLLTFPGPRHFVNFSTKLYRVEKCKILPRFSTPLAFESPLFENGALYYLKYKQNRGAT